jgi:hypothetical protein
VALGQSGQRFVAAYKFNTRYLLSETSRNIIPRFVAVGKWPWLAAVGHGWPRADVANRSKPQENPSQHLASDLWLRFVAAAEWLRLATVGRVATLQTVANRSKSLANDLWIWERLICGSGKV